MRKIMYCDLCQREVVPVKEFSWLWFILLCATGAGGIFYCFYYWWIKKEKYCPICGNDRLEVIRRNRGNA